MLIGLVGKPSAGKSTFFKALTLADVAIANYPFTTIKPNHGVGHVRVKRIDREFNVTATPREGYLAGDYRFVPVELMDVAGLVPGAHEGKGMGNQFLDDLRQADVLIHVVDVSGSLNEKGEPVDTGSYDPAEDIKFLEFELDMWYLGIFQKIWKRFANMVNQTKEDTVKAIAKQFSGLKVNEDMVKRHLKDMDLIDKAANTWTDAALKDLVIRFRKETKPMVIAANKIDIPGAGDKFEALKQQFPEHKIIGCSAETELALKESARHGLTDYIPGAPGFNILEPDKLNEKQKAGLNFIKNFLESYKSTGCQQVLDSAVFEVLGNIAIFPGGVGKLQDSEGRVLPDCFILPGGSTALDFAYKIHSTMGDNFIRAINVRTKIGMKKDHPLQHRDIVELVFNK